MEKELTDHLAQLEARLAALEQQITPAAPPRPPASNTLWALNHLQEHGVDGVLFAGQVNLPVGGTVAWQYGLPTRSYFAQDWDAAAPVLAALGSPARLRLLRAILNGQTRNADLASLDEVGSTGQLYHHLRELVAAGWLKPAGRGAHRVPGERVVPLLTILAATETLEFHPGADQ
ncbi:winged helix-turn-helix domain-containing protein (plasmid) [Deinococcus taeanensis]|uniref:winged helix-turn-helix domain-containing protein n=1 Tax=Deinococcus taeanensis TaxID=2737050 RepID=UPI001CDC6694|nr:winged helix-turn-helix domain-containing protein [Deinococcus taeanensis]UBV44717.1 winged helix-turn-helix domain-containing protein [Deinococcus taeanensis]